ncbi:hypothetical protein BC936DRAFT_145400 [Jimgerdemannia flammicorona]|uniref:Uncharacterized protein n=1 Tax=Jimgerdemannia flammicorona TaxID=994334 RepID=A0A433DA33_9FUNG|nr:hypothetical protein BC936DRAFT_145400 [Jimgerdemannia flammicorona]
MIAHYDQLCHFTYNLFKYIFILNSTKIIIVYTEDDTSNSAAQELFENILTINTIFICQILMRVMKIKI